METDTFGISGDHWVMDKQGKMPREVIINAIMLRVSLYMAVSFWNVTEQLAQLA